MSHTKSPLVSSQIDANVLGCTFQDFARDAAIPSLAQVGERESASRMATSSRYGGAGGGSVGGGSVGGGSVGGGSGGGGSGSESGSGSG